MSNLRIQEALDNAEANVAFLATLSDKKLSEKLDAIHLQSEIAVQKKQTASIELLEIWRSQVIAARIYKAENNIPDAPNKIELAIADIETFTSKAEERQDMVNEIQQPDRPTRTKKPIQTEDDSQLELF